MYTYSDGTTICTAMFSFQLFGVHSSTDNLYKPETVIDQHIACPLTQLLTKHF